MEYKQFIIKNNTLTIVKKRLPFYVTKEKCQEYLLSHGFIIKNDNTLTRCCHIFNILIKYVHENYLYEKYICFVKRYHNCWNLKFIENDSLDNLNGLFYYSQNAFIMCKNHNYTLKDLLIDDQKYHLFLQYWSNQFNYEDLFNVLDEISIKLCNPLPYEVIDIILLYAYASYNKLNY